MNQSKYLSEVLERLPKEQIYNLKKQWELSAERMNEMTENFLFLKSEIKKGKNPIKDIDLVASNTVEALVGYLIPGFKNLYKLSCPILGVEKSREFIIGLIEELPISQLRSYNPKNEILKKLNF